LNPWTCSNPSSCSSSNWNPVALNSKINIPASSPFTATRGARRIVDEVYEVCNRKWRGIGELPLSGLRLRSQYSGFDAEKVFGLESSGVEEDSECISAQVLMGQKKPTDCPAFGNRCTPERPLGAPMVSTEGACAAYHQYKQHLIQVAQ